MSTTAQVLVARSVSGDHEMVAQPIPTDWILSGTPNARCRGLTDADDAGATSALWDCSAGRFMWHYGVDETVHILDGEARVTCPSGNQIVLRAGDVAHFPAGISAEWEVPEYVKKLAFLAGRRSTVGALARRAAKRVPFARQAVRILRTMRFAMFALLPTAAGLCAAQDQLLAF